MAKGKNIYSLLNKYRAMMLENDINQVIKKLNNESLDKETKWILASIIFREQTKISSIASKRIAEYTGLDDVGHSKDMSVVARELGKLKDNIFNNMLEFSTRLMRARNVRYVNLALVTLRNGQLSKLNSEIIDKLDYKKPILFEIALNIPDFTIKCDICGKDKTPSEFEQAYSCCRECKKAQYTGRRGSIKSGATYQMALASAKEIKKDLKGEFEHGT